MGPLRHPHFSFEVVDYLPRIPDEVLQIVFWCYGSLDCAKRRDVCGGTGFLVNAPSADFPALHHVFGVTNKHVIHGHCQRNSPQRPCNGFMAVVLNHPSGQPEILEKDQDRVWEPHDGGVDLAACYFGLRPKSEARFMGVAVDEFLTKARFDGLEVGPGDATFMVGRYINHDGKISNAPSVRFGQISMVPGDSISTTEGPQVGYIVELISQGGFSGSPVFLNLPPGITRGPSFRKPTQTPITWQMYLMGVDFGHLTTNLSVVRTADGTTTGNYVSWPTGANLVIPAWKVEELLKQPNLTRAMRDAEDELKRTVGASGQVATPSRATPDLPTKPIEPDDQSRERFTALLDAAVGKQKQGG